MSFNKLLNGQFFEKDIVIEKDSFEGELLIDNFYDSKLIVLCLSKNKTGLLEPFSIDHYLHSLYIHKYFFCDNEIYFSNFIFSEVDTPTYSEIKISKISDFLEQEVFISALFKTYLRSNNHPLVHFHFLYQIIELLIERVYDYTLNEVLNKNSYTSPHELKKAITDLTPEEYRIGQVFSKKFQSKNISATVALLNSCNTLLSANFKNEEKNYTQAIYRVRNLLVHNFRTVADKDTNYEFLREVNKNFERILVETLSHYVEPNKDSDPLAWQIYQLYLFS